MALLDQDQIEQKLSKLNVEWTVTDGTHLERVYKFDNFSDALKFVNKVGVVVERENHHPDIELSWGKVVIRFTTHDQQGLTSKDFKLAKELEEI